ncbi:MAG: hypothetical protein F2681_09810 [Actinobacteria bacterium]|uniref:Unannotated protein n=1 Tax=freshwater metagenome TaxID=449393 RepID=A0A6J6S2V6_9ZZZZ|nr:hypothetical protein [Actinomycetota bacterium]MSW76836.1 hypothetical protein [Actinomycetota bacterium]MSX53904.1 hypothetical protein [Actinomycetota bacterium]MSX92282.1 hypothetical protein [Actinomycetota bacterium]MSZ83426.1 hypothetical protein [Actinomycetota bacterium]
MFDTLGGLPAHPLLVHIPVVLIPLAALGALAIAVRPRWMRSFGWLLAGVAGVGLLGAIFAAQSGEAYKETLEATGQTITSTLEDHAEMGDAAQGFAAVFFALLAVWVLFAWWRRRSGEEKVTAVVKQPKVIAIILSVLVVVSGIAATASVTVTGHSGAKSVWESKK